MTFQRGDLVDFSTNTYHVRSRIISYWAAGDYYEVEVLRVGSGGYAWRAGQRTFFLEENLRPVPALEQLAEQAA